MSNDDSWISRLALLSACALAAHAGTARAEVVSVGGGGFEVRETLHVNAAPDKTYAMLLAPDKWWSSDHTFSHDAANLTLDPRVGGCWCEKLPGGGEVEHLRVQYLMPGKGLRLRGALGPFQSLAVEGVMTFALKPADGGTDIVLTYVLGGYAKDGFEAGAKAADQVLTLQVGRLKKAIDG
jgi:hypothetical protein